MKSTANDIREIAHQVLDLLLNYVDESKKADLKVLVQHQPEDMAQSLDLENLIRHGALDSKNIEAFLRTYLENTQHMHHPAYIGHQVAVPHLVSSLADMIHGFVNNPMAIYEMGPAPATIEKVVVNWMLQKIGWFQADSLHESDDRIISGGGVLTHGGSLANLTAMLAARARMAPECWEEGLKEELYVLVPATSHYSLARSVSIMGMGSNHLLHLELNKNEQVIPEKLEQQLKMLASEGKKVMAVVANACATGTGLYDPIDEIATICNKHGVWLHIDGAHGAGALMSEKYLHLMKGIQKADSMIWDAHKMLRTSALSAGVLFRDFRDLANTFQQEGSYIFFDKEKIGYDFMHNTVECTKAPLGTKIFWALAAEGEEGITQYIENQYQKTMEFYQLINRQHDFDCPYQPESNILCFKYVGKDPSDDFQLKLRNQLVLEGDYYITSTTIHNKRYLRLTVMNPDTDLNTIIGLLDAIREVGGRM